MSISFSCSSASCGRKMRVADDAVGKNVRCPACGAIQVVPAPVTPVGVGQGVAQPQVDPAAKVCPMCQTRLDASSVVCITCGFDFRRGERLVKFPNQAGGKSASKSSPAVWIAGGGVGALLIIVLLLFLLLRSSSAPNDQNAAAQKPSDAKPAPSESSTPAAAAYNHSSATPETANKSNPRQSLKVIALAMYNYEAVHKTFPPAFSADANGKPLLSWRVLILPYMLNCDDLYKQFHLDEPWDSEHNKTLIARMPPVFQNPDSRLASEGKTTFLTFRGEKTVYPGGKALGFGSVTDGASLTLMTIEVPDSRAVVWTKPDDLELDRVNSAEGLGALRPAGFYVGFVDGSVTFLKASIPLTALIALSSRNGGESVSTGGWQARVPQVKKRVVGSIPAPQIDAAAAGAKAIAQFDVNRDGKLSGDELYLCPGLNAAIEKLDPKDKREITAEKITERIKTWQKSKIGRMALTCTVLRNGKPLAGAEVRFVPENFLGEAYQVATGTTDNNGMAQISIPTTGPDDPPGVPCGFYNVEIAKPGEYIPTKYNANTILGQEIALDAAGITEGVKFELEY